MKYDAAVIGGGHNGLVAACYLAKHGLRVGLFEKNNFLGGMAASPELWQGFKVPLGAYVLSLFSRSIASELGLFERGLRLIPKEPGMTVLLPGGRTISSWSDLEKMRREIARFSERDAERYLEWSRTWELVGEVLDYIYSSPPMSLPEALEVASKATRFASSLGLGSLVEDLPRLLLSPASRLLDEFFESEEVKALLVEDALVGELVAPSSPGSALVMAHHYMGAITGKRGQWAYVAGGMGALSEILAQICRELGVEVHLGARVEEIVVKNEKVEGLRVNGKLVEAPRVLSTVDARVTLLGLVKDIEKGLARRLRALRSVGASSKLIIASRGLPRLKEEYRGAADKIFSSSALVLESVEYAERAYREALVKGFSSEPWMSINTQSYVDPSVAPEGWHIISVFMQYTRNDVPGGWEGRREELRARALETLSRYFEDLRAEKFLLLVPADYESLFGAPGGHIFHLSMTPDQLWVSRPLPELSHYRTPIKGLYLGGASCHPGGGVTGVPGYLAAKALLEDAGVIRQRRVSFTGLVLDRIKRKIRL
ncbi:MAG: NAD(P)/FAD-dependent oxidoreductase [Acidilobaceae archaeon]|nr:NAD(P)/FAD-dependent oxidoreductase [Acidilobaceae archaeon]